MQNMEENLKNFEIKQQKLVKQGKVIFWIYIILGFITGFAFLFVGIMQIFSSDSTTVRDLFDTQQYLAYGAFFLGIFIIMDCYMLLKGNEGARIFYGIFMAICALVFIYLLLVGEINYFQEKGIVLACLAFAGIYISAVLVLPVNKGVKEYMYEREVKDIRED